jgi:hypothetical protein
MTPNDKYIVSGVVWLLVFIGCVALLTFFPPTKLDSSEDVPVQIEDDFDCFELKEDVYVSQGWRGHETTHIFQDGECFILHQEDVYDEAWAQKMTGRTNLKKLVEETRKRKADAHAQH